MTIRKAKLGKKIESDILRVLNNSQIPISTRNIALKIKRAWHAVQFHCMKLQLADQVVGYKISNLNVWQIKK